MKDYNYGLGGIGTGGGKGKGKNEPNQHKLEAEARREAKKKQQDNERAEPVEEFPFPEDYGDGSRIEFSWTRTHKHLLERIIEQIADDCWAWAFVRILQFYYNKDITAIAEQKFLSIKSLVKYVILGKEDAKSDKKLGKKSLALSSLKKAIDYIKVTGIEKDHGTETYKIKATFVAEPHATPEDIQRLLRTQGPIGISVDVCGIFSRSDKFKEIYVLNEPKEGMERHALIIVGYGTTKDGKLFFIVQNTWGTTWGFNGYARIIIKNTCPIFYVRDLVK